MADKVCFPLRGSSEGEMKSKNFPKKKTLPYFKDKCQGSNIRRESLYCH